MTGQNPAHRLGRLQDDGEWLRERLSAVATSIAYTEDQVAETLERMAHIRPDDATRLRARAAQARQFATLERGWAAKFGKPRRSVP